MKENTPLFLRPNSPEREGRFVNTLADIPEATPGPNAFAQQAARMDRHREDGNAFYQMQKRKATPITGVHPALRPRSNSDPPTPPRDSTITTMSPFIDAGREQHYKSPALKLVPSDADIAIPTLRGVVEERREQADHVRDGSSEERIPVFVPTPKVACNDFAMPAATPKRRAEKAPSIVEPPSKTPKKGFFGRLKLTTNLRTTQSPSTTTLNSATKVETDENVPVKAQAVLGASPSKKGRSSLGSSISKSNLPRSPSKRKGFFSRKNTGLAEVSEQNTSIQVDCQDAEQAPLTASSAPLTASSATKTPPTAFSDPTHYSYQNKRIFSQTNSDGGIEKGRQTNPCSVTRSQSLKYFDHSIPPTPPAKNTPPDERARREAERLKNSSRVPFHDEPIRSPAYPDGLVSTSGRISPTRFGSYGRKDMPTLVTQPSLYSLRASVVPNLTEANTFEEMKARVDGLGLEGFNMPQENVHGSKLAQVYSPSIYSSDWKERPETVLINGDPAVHHFMKSPNCQSTHTKESSSSGGEIPIVYPGLLKDPSVTSLTPLRAVLGQKRNQSDTNLELRRPRHGCTYSLDHSNTNSPRPSVDSSVFAHHVTNDPVCESPTSFNHPSATPSPLQLQPTAYKPPPRMSSKLSVPQRPEVKIVEIGKRKAHGKGLGIKSHVRSNSDSPTKRNDVFDNAPSLPAHTASNRAPSPSPQNGGEDSGRSPECDTDPKKPSPQKSPSTDKLDRVIEILNTLHARNNEMNIMRDEIRATNERLDSRLAAVENFHRASPFPTYALDEGISNERGSDDSHSLRVPTDVAHEFYQQGDVSDSDVSDRVRGSDTTDSDTIAELKETNKRILEMVGGLSEKIMALEKRSGSSG